MHEQLRPGRGSAVRKALKRLFTASNHSDQKHLTSDDTTHNRTDIWWLSCLCHSSPPDYEVYLPIQTISRTPDGRFVLTPSPDTSGDNATDVGNKDPVNHQNSHDGCSNPRTSGLRPPEHKDFHLPQDYLSRREHVMSPPRNYQELSVRSPHTPLGLGWYDDPYYQHSNRYKFGAWRDGANSALPSQGNGAHPGVIMTPLYPTPASQRSINKTYLTSSPDHDGGPFIISDISSVNPSFSTSGDRSRDQHGNLVNSDLSSQWSLGNPGAQNKYSLRPRLPIAEDYYREMRVLAGRYGHHMDSPGSLALYKIGKSQEGSPHEFVYTRDDLERAIQRVRSKSPMRAAHTPQGSMDSPADPQDILHATQRVRSPFKADHTPQGSLDSAGSADTRVTHSSKDVFEDDIPLRTFHHPWQPTFSSSVAPYKSSPAHQGSSSSSGVGSTRHVQNLLPPNLLHSPNTSGIGSRETSQSTGSFSCHDKRQERCEQLRREYLAFQQSQHSGDYRMGQDTYVRDIESEML